MLTDLRNIIEKESKKKEKKWCTHRQYGRGVLAGTCPQHCMGSFSPVFRSISVILLSKDGLGSEEQNRKEFEKKNKEMAHAQAKWRGVHPRAQSCPFPIQIA